MNKSNWYKVLWAWFRLNVWLLQLNLTELKWYQSMTVSSDDEVMVIMGVERDVSFAAGNTFVVRRVFYNCTGLKVEVGKTFIWGQSLLETLFKE